MNNTPDNNEEYEYIMDDSFKNITTNTDLEDKFKQLTAADDNLDNIPSDGSLDKSITLKSMVYKMKKTEKPSSKSTSPKVKKPSSKSTSPKVKKTEKETIVLTDLFDKNLCNFLQDNKKLDMTRRPNNLLNIALETCVPNLPPVKSIMLGGKYNLVHKFTYPKWDSLEEFKQLSAYRYIKLAEYFKETRLEDNYHLKTFTTNNDVKFYYMGELDGVNYTVANIKFDDMPVGCKLRIGKVKTVKEYNKDFTRSMRSIFEPIDDSFQVTLAEMFLRYVQLYLMGWLIDNHELAAFKKIALRISLDQPDHPVEIYTSEEYHIKKVFEYNVEDSTKRIGFIPKDNLRVQLMYGKGVMFGDINTMYSIKCYQKPTVKKYKDLDEDRNSEATLEELEMRNLD